MQVPLISIITTTYNSASTLKDTVNSVLNQTYSSFEYIIIDGNSIDSTVDLIKSFEAEFNKKDIKFRWISEPDTGIYDAFNKGVKLANGDWISFLGSDDMYTKNAVELYIKNLPKNEVDLLYSNIKIIGKKNNTGVWSWHKFRRSMNIGHVGAFHNKNYFNKYGMFNTSYEIAGDYEILLRAKENLRTHKINDITVIMADGGVSNKQVRKVYRETTRAKKETAEVSSIICFLDYYKWMLKYNIKRIIYALVG